MAKVSDKLVKVNESFTVNMYDNGYMIDIGGKNKKDDWTSTKIVVQSVEELMAIVQEVTNMEIDR